MPKKVELKPDVLVSVVSQYNEGTSMRSLSISLGITVPTMRRILTDAGCKIRPGTRSRKLYARPVPGVVGMKKEDESEESKEVKLDKVRREHNRKLDSVRSTEVQPDRRPTVEEEDGSTAGSRRSADVAPVRELPPTKHKVIKW